MLFLGKLKRNRGCSVVVGRVGPCIVLGIRLSYDEMDGEFIEIHKEITVTITTRICAINQNRGWKF